MYIENGPKGKIRAVSDRRALSDVSASQSKDRNDPSQHGAGLLDTRGCSLIDVDSNRPTCAGVRVDGQQCRASPTNGGWRIGHDPALAEQRAEGRRRGGRNKSNAARTKKLLPARLEKVVNTLEKALEETHSGAIDSRVGSAMATLASALVRAYQIGNLEERVLKLEERNNESK